MARDRGFFRRDDNYRWSVEEKELEVPRELKKGRERVDVAKSSLSQQKANSELLGSSGVVTYVSAFCVVICSVGCCIVVQTANK